MLAGAGECEYSGIGANVTLGLIAIGTAVPPRAGNCTPLERKRECIGSIPEAQLVAVRMITAPPLATLMLAFFACFGTTRRTQSTPVAFLIFLDTSAMTSSNHKCPPCCAYTTRSKMSQQEQASRPKDEQEVSTVMRMHIHMGCPVAHVKTQSPTEKAATATTRKMSGDCLIQMVTNHGTRCPGERYMAWRQVTPTRELTALAMLNTSEEYQNAFTRLFFHPSVRSNESWIVVAVTTLC